MISPVVVVVNTMKPIYTCLAPSSGNYDGAVVSGFFIAPTTPAVPHTIASIYMDGVGENIGQRITPLVTLADCVRGTA